MSKRRYFESRQVPPRHYWTIVRGWEWKILLSLQLKIAQGRGQNLTHWVDGLGTEQQGQMSTSRGQTVLLGSRGGTLGLILVPLESLCNPLPHSV